MSTTPGLAPRAPGVGWLIGCSLWLLPVLFGFGMTSWIGFGVIGILVVRIRWVLLAVAWLVVLSWLDIGPDSLPRFLDRVSYGYFEPASDIPLLLLYLAGVAYGVHANRVWLRILAARREWGLRMLGPASPARVRAGAAAPVPAPEPPAAPVPAPTSRNERAELLTRAAGDFRALLARETERMRRSLAAAAAAPAVAAPAAAAPAAGSVLAAPTVLPTPLSTTLLGLPSGPVDVRTASVTEIAGIPGIGPERAAQLVAARDTHPIASVDDVVALLGLTGVDRVRAHPYLRF